MQHLVTCQTLSKLSASNLVFFLLSSFIDGFQGRSTLRLPFLSSFVLSLDHSFSNSDLISCSPRILIHRTSSQKAFLSFSSFYSPLDVFDSKARPLKWRARFNLSSELTSRSLSLSPWLLTRIMGTIYLSLILTIRCRSVISSSNNWSDVVSYKNQEDVAGSHALSPY